ncbi:thiosulfohydrolase SoxB [Paramagnetospirillum kuznetsovii]|uniref:Thiosulfohydrolase SoxB n=1 Tax=Paramagnetospirillum kuznetsovii TaxID=2053833 RepID=A0A364NUV3_9PROT|nr:thiosulfohydrolase SoxB [Paramagnetospirillum kuznetsovii]RAU20861.1 thiosulfohydrolase SoxB [Paramagnetospirillum kuznetsovii]
MLTRRDFLQVAAAAAAMTGAPLGQAAAAQTITQDSLLRFKPVGQVTLLAFTDIHAQLKPLYFREPSVNLGVGAAKGLPPHLTGKDFLKRFGLKGGGAEAYALTSEDFSQLGKTYGKVGGLDRMATLVKAIRAERPGKTLLIDSGDTWQGSYTALKTGGEDMVDAMNLLGVEAMTAHWEFTYGEARVKELVEKLKFPFLCGNVKDNEWEEDAFAHTAAFERGGVKIAVIGQAFPYTPVANPRWMMPKWSFGIREEDMQKRVNDARAKGADLVVVASHNGFDVDRKMASRVKGIDVMLTGHTHDAIPELIRVGDTLLVASGSHGKFLGRLDLEVKGKKVTAHSFRLIPVFSDAIRPDAEMAALIERIRAPHAAELGRVVGRTKGLLYRRGNFNGTFDDLICDALLSERDAQIALSPGFRWGSSLLPGQDITVEDVYNQTAITYPNAYRSEMTGAMMKDIMEDVADNLLHPDPYYQQGGDMVRVGGMSYAIDPAKPVGERISDMRLIKTGEKLDAAKSYVVSGWASVNPDTQGPPVWDVVMGHLAKHGEVNLPENRSVKVVGG